MFCIKPKKTKSVALDQHAASERINFERLLIERPEGGQKLSLKKCQSLACRTAVMFGDVLTKCFYKTDKIFLKKISMI